MATGCLSLPKVPDIEGADRFQGDVYSTTPVAARGRRLHRQARRRDRHRVVGHPVDPDHRRAGRAARPSSSARPNFSRPAKNGPVPQDKLDAYAAGREAFREAARWSMAGVHAADRPRQGALQVSEEERLAKFEEVWESGDLLRAVVRRHAHERGGQRDASASSSGARSARS